MIGEDMYVYILDKFRSSKLGKRRVNLFEFYSVRLGIVFGLILIIVVNLVFVKKNIRLCGDCYIVVKKIFKSIGREIIVGDFKIFYYFKDGKCLCGDYW